MSASIICPLVGADARGGRPGETEDGREVWEVKRERRKTEL